MPDMTNCLKTRRFLGYRPIVFLLLLLPNILVAQDSSTANKESRFQIKLPTKSQTSPLATFTIELLPSDAKPGEIVTLTIEAEIADSWHIYPLATGDGDVAGTGLPTKIVFKATGLSAIDDNFSATEQPEIILKNGKRECYFEGKFGWTRRYQVAENAESFSATGSISFQACDAKMCVPPKRLAFQLGVQPTATSTEASKENNVADVIHLETEACSLKRPQAKFGSLAAVLSQRDDKLFRKCTVNVEGKQISIFIPKEDEYSLLNTSDDNTPFGNTSTYISIDQNGDGKLDKSEAVPTNLPIRILNTMFEIVDLPEDASKLSLRRLNVPLQGVVLNRPCPEFSFQTVDGQTVSNTSILGKVTILDIWAVT